MSEAPKRTEADIEADLQRTREELANSVNELANRLSPKANAKAAADGAKKNAQKFAARAKTIPTDAQNGDSTAIGILAGVAGTVALATFLIFKK